MVREEFLEVAGELASRQQGFSDLPLEEIIEQIYSSGAEIMEKHDVLIAIIFKERSVIDLLEWEQFAAILKEQRRWFPALLKERAARGEIREIDYESAAATLSALLMDHFLVKLTGMGTGCLGDETFRKRLIRFHIGLWKGSAPETPVL